MTLSASFTGAPCYTETYEAEPLSAPRARQQMALVLYVWSMPDLVDDAQLVVTEMVANAVQHSGRGEIHVAVRRERHGVRIDVTDACPSLPVHREAGPSEEYGRGIPIIASLSQAWGVDPAPEGKTVWAQLSRPR